MKRIFNAAGPLLLAIYPFLLLWCVLGVPATTDAFAPPAFQFFALPVIALTAVLTGYWLALTFRPGRLKSWYRPNRQDWIVACVVWIVGLAGLVRLVGGVMEKASAAKIANDGRNIANALRERMATHAMLATLAGETNGSPPRLGPVPGDHATANEWFASLLSDASTTGIDAHSLFLLAPSEEWEHPPGESGMATNHCLWNCLAGIDDCQADATPFLWSANLRGVTADDFSGADPGRPRSWADRCDRKRIPGLGRHVVIIRKSGQMDVWPASELTDALFLGGSSGDPARIQVLPARP